MRWKSWDTRGAKGRVSEMTYRGPRRLVAGQKPCPQRTAGPVATEVVAGFKRFAAMTGSLRGSLDGVKLGREGNDGVSLLFEIAWIDSLES